MLSIKPNPVKYRSWDCPILVPGLCCWNHVWGQHPPTGYYEWVVVVGISLVLDYYYNTSQICPGLALDNMQWTLSYVILTRNFYLKLEHEIFLTTCISAGFHSFNFINDSQIQYYNFTGSLSWAAFSNLSNKIMGFQIIG